MHDFQYSLERNIETKALKFLFVIFNFILDLQWWVGAIVGAMIVFTATCGDLIESAMKRDLQLKDMGTMLPGHGGILDRLDSVLISAPALWLALELVKRWS